MVDFTAFHHDPHGVPSPPQILRQIHLHLRGGLERHRVQVRVKFRQEAEVVAFDHPRGLHPGLVVGEPVFRRQARHADVNAGLLGISLRVGNPDSTEPAGGGVEQDYLHVVVVIRAPVRREAG